MEALLRDDSGQVRGVALCDGTTITFHPDEQIFKTTHFDPDLIKSRLEDMSYIHSGLKITFKDEGAGTTEVLEHSGGIADYLPGDRVIVEQNIEIAEGVRIEGRR